MKLSISVDRCAEPEAPAELRSGFGRRPVHDAHVSLMAIHDNTVKGSMHMHSVLI